MRLKVLTPTEVIIDQPVLTLVAEGENGHFGIKPRHIDFISALVPGLLYFLPETKDEGQYLAVDRGILVKHAAEVYVSVRDAVKGEDLAGLLEIVQHRFMQLEEKERGVRSAVARLEADFLRRFMELS
jgi:F-type H+-transporting ATPase subunit epsilon